MPRGVSYRAGRGQAITELALLTPILAIILLGIVEVAGAYGTQMNLRNAVYQAARIGALGGNGGQTAFTCPNTTSGITDTVDMSMTRSILNSPGIDSNNIASIQVYKAGVNPGTVEYTGTTQELNQYVYPFISGTNLITSTYNWPSCLRQSSEPADSLGVHVTYRYHPITPLFGNNTLTLNATSVVRLNPTRNDNPCPVPEAPTDVTAHWIGPEPSSTDAITWTAIPNATSYKIYAGVNGSAAGTSPVYTVNSPPSSGPVTVNYTYSPPFPAASQVSYKVQPITTYCTPGTGDISDPVPDGQYALPITPTIITATAAITPGYDYLSWTAVPDAQSYTITQTASTGSQVVTTVAAPMTSTAIQDPYHNPPVASVTYAVAATSLSTVQGPSATAVIATSAAPTVTVDDAMTSTASAPFTFAYTPGKWVACGPSTTPTCSTTPGVSVSVSSLYSNTLTLTNQANATATITFTGTQITLYGAVQPNGGQSIPVSIDSGAFTGTANFYTSSPGSASGNVPVYTSPTLSTTPASHTLILTLPSGFPTSKYVGIDRAVVQQ